MYFSRSGCVCLRCRRPCVPSGVAVRSFRRITFFFSFFPLLILARPLAPFFFIIYAVPIRMYTRETKFDSIISTYRDRILRIVKLDRQKKKKNYAIYVIRTSYRPETIRRLLLLPDATTVRVFMHNE